MKKILEKLTERLRSEEAMASLVLFSAGQILAQVANGTGPLSLGRIARRALSNPAPRRGSETARKENKGGKRR